MIDPETVGASPWAPAGTGVLEEQRRDDSGSPGFEQHAETDFWAPGFASLALAFAVFLTVNLWALRRAGTPGLLSWYTAVVWTLPALLTVQGLAGAVITALRRRPVRRRREAVSGPVATPLVVVVPTVGRADTIPALERAVRSFSRHLPRRFTNVRIDVVVEEGCEAHDHLRRLAARDSAVRLLTVPAAYRTANDTRFKARANHYANERRVLEGDASDDVWVLHMDDDTAVGADTADAIASFVLAQQDRHAGRLHLGQGILSYPRENTRNRLVWLADAVRPGCDVSLFALSTGSGTPRTGLHGELLLVRASVEAAIGWDFGPRTIVEDAHFALLFAERYPGRSGWFAGRSYGASPDTVADFIRQRERWVWGLLQLITTAGIPLRRRLLLMHNVVVWSLSPLQHPLIIIAVAGALGDFDTTPAAAVLAPVWSLNAGFVVWLYWEGLKINVSASSGRRRWWEPLCVILLLPCFSLWEATGIARGCLRFLRRAESTFTVIPKPL